MEFADWEMLMINPVFKARLEEAEEYLLAFCQELDAFRDSLWKFKKRKFVQILTYEIGWYRKFHSIQSARADKESSPRVYAKLKPTACETHASGCSETSA